MELRLLYGLARKWVWLIAIGILVGGAGGYLLTQTQAPVYQALTTVLVMPEGSTSGQATSRTQSEELVRNYTQLVNTRPVLSSTAQRLGYPLNGGQVTVRAVPQTRMFQVRAEALIPQQAADIANTVVVVLIEQNDALQENVFTSAAVGIQAQIAQVETRIQSLEDEIVTLSDENISGQERDLRSNIDNLEIQVTNLQREIANLESQKLAAERAQADVLAAEALVEATPTQTEATSSAEVGESSDAEGAPTPTIAPSPTPLPEFTLEQQVDLTEKIYQLDRLNGQLDRFERAYFDLTISGTTDSSNTNESMRLSQLRTRFDFYQTLYTSLLSEYEAARMATLSDRINIVQVDEARVPETPIRPILATNLMIGIFAGLAVTMSIAFLVEYADDTLKTPDAVRKVLGLPIIGFVNHVDSANNLRQLLINTAPRSLYSESIRTLRTNLEYAQVDSPLKTLLISSPLPGDGKTMTAANLATATAQSGKRVILIDADLRRPMQHEVFEVSNQYGLTSILTHQLEIEDALQSTTAHPNLLLLTSGPLPPNPTELLGSESMRRMLHKLTEIADTIIIDASPFVVSDATVLAGIVDGTLMVLRASKTKEGAAQAMLEQLRRTKSRVVGVVFNRFQPKRDSQYYYYYNTQYYNSIPEASRSNGERANGFFNARRKWKKTVKPSD
jgi:capsular exopolysaccharide synthesis family protein